MSTSNIRSSLYQCLEQTLDASKAFQLIALNNNDEAYSITMYISLSSSDKSLVNSANTFFEINLTSSSGSEKPNYNIRNANINFKNDDSEINIYFNGNALYLVLPDQMKATVRKEIKYGQFANLLSSSETTDITFSDDEKICAITNMTEDASNGTYLVDSDGTTAYAKHILPSVNGSNVVSGSNIGTDTDGEGGWYANAYIQNLHVGSTDNVGKIEVDGSASTASVSVTNTLSVTGNDPTDGTKAAASVGTLEVSKTLKSSGDTSAKNILVEGTLSATTTAANEIGVSTKTLSTPSLKATGSVEITGTDSLNYSGISPAATSSNDEEKPVWISKGKSSSDDDKGIPTIAEGLTYNPQTKTLKCDNFNGTATNATNDAEGSEISQTYAKSSSLAAVATSGNYNSLTNRPTKLSDFTNDSGYTTNAGTVTSVAVQMNGSLKGTVTSSGTIDLGTVLTAHQSLEEYMKTANFSYSNGVLTIKGI